MLKRALKRLFLPLKWPFVARRFASPEPRFIYALTPPPSLKNIGDHAQVVAIRAWLAKHFSTHAVIELDKDEVTYLLRYFKKHIQRDDIILLHSGGNLGDRGKWSERARRLMILNFPNNKIVSLPQTIHFSATRAGQSALAQTRRIYGSHPNLTIIARDQQSYVDAQKYFPAATVSSCPDFVFSYEGVPKNVPSNGKWLYCLRRDTESALDDSTRRRLFAFCDCQYDVYDTTLDRRIPKDQRRDFLDDALALFSKYDLIVTDRYHGLIFAYLCSKPTIVLPTVDHKLTSTMDWLGDLPMVRFARSIEDVPALVHQLSSVLSADTLDWNTLYFDRLVDLVTEETT